MQLPQQQLRLLQIKRVEPLGEPAVDRGELFASLLPLTLERHSRAMLIAARSSQDLARFRSKAGNGADYLAAKQRTA